MVLVRGNHDRRAGDPPGEWRIVCVDPPVVVGAFALCHDPQPVAGHYAGRTTRFCPRSAASTPEIDARVFVVAGDTVVPAR